MFRDINERVLDVEPFELLYDGTLVAAGDTSLELDVPHLGRVAVQLIGVRERALDVDDGPFVIDEARFEDGVIKLFGERGVIRIDCDHVSLSPDIATLRARVVAHWGAWRAALDVSAMHPLVRDAVVGGAWSRASLPTLVEAWRVERTSDLADVVDVLDRMTSPVRYADVSEPEQLADWPARYARAPFAALDQLVRCAYATFDTLRAERPSDRDAEQLGAWLDARSARNERWWDALAIAIATLRDAAPDPRIGRAVVAMLRSSSDHWFRIDQVAHVITSFPAPHARASFADHAFTLLRGHADAGSPDRLDARADAVSIEADCNGAEMADRLHALAAELATRYPRDRVLPRHARVALRYRSLL